MSIIIGISGASGAIYGVELLKALRALKVETHLIVSKTAQITLAHETPYSLAEVQKLATHFHKNDDLAACTSSGSHKTAGMIIAPCSMRSLAEIATGVTSNLLTRSADVCLKERRKLVLMVRETPLHSIHLRNMLTLSDMGAVIAPPVPAFYSKPKNIDEMVKYTVARILDNFDLDAGKIARWQGLSVKNR
ncbi:MAG: UbiX family flavin prenyltransferase [Alphaproteobacteria bacterium]|nr:UbiX family flavin prenyltransferase [Alphaproteobacteria bacterium]